MAEPFPVSRFVGRSLMVLARVSSVILSLALLGITLQGNVWREFNQGGGSAFLDVLLQPWLTIVLALAMLAYLVARFKVIPRPRTPATDLMYLVTVLCLLGIVQVAAYLPVLQAPPV